MTADVHSLMTIYKGWDGYQVSLVRAIAPLSREQLAYRPASHLRSAGEIARHISEGRLGWFQRTFGVSSTEVATWSLPGDVKMPSKSSPQNWSEAWRPPGR